jgi:hypothetical protein
MREVITVHCQGYISLQKFSGHCVCELARAVEELQQEGMIIAPEQLAHLSPMDWEHINLTGDYVWDLTVKSRYARQA